MTLYGLIGYPLSHSFSKKYFAEKFLNEKISAEFVNFEISDIKEFQNIITKNPTLKGLSITIPHKETIMPLLDDISAEAKQIGAVNCVKVLNLNNKTETKGFNTDLDGFKDSLLKFLKNVKPEKALILGTGGASKAVALALDRLGISYEFVSRNRNPNVLVYEELSKDTLEKHKLIINTTPLGTFPRNDTYPDINYKFLTPCHFLYDLTYNPKDTLFLKKGRKFGANTKNGLEMLHLQAEKSWAIWNT